MLYLDLVQMSSDARFTNYNRYIGDINLAGIWIWCKWALRCSSKEPWHLADYTENDIGYISGLDVCNCF